MRECGRNSEENRQLPARTQAGEGLLDLLKHVVLQHDDCALKIHQSLVRYPSKQKSKEKNNGLM